LGLAYLKQEQFGKAEMMYRKLTQGATGRSGFFKQPGGGALPAKKNWKEAKNYYSKAIELDNTPRRKVLQPGKGFA